MEDLVAWVEARKLAKILFETCKRLPREEKFAVVAHINENSRHIPANIAEGFMRFYLRDSIQFYRVALGSLGEVRSDLYLCFDRGYIDGADLGKYLEQIDLVEKLVIGLANSANKVKNLRSS